MREAVPSLRISRRALIGSTTALAGGLAFGCSSGGGSLGSGSTAEGKVTLVVPTSQAPWNPAYAKLVEEYQKETGNKIDLRPFPNPDVKTQQINDIQSQRHTFDVFQINEADLVQFNVNDWIQPLTDVDTSYAPDSAIYSYSNIARWNADKRVFDPDGKLTSQPLLGNVDVFMYRKDIYQQLGLSVPTTWDDVISNGQQIQAANAAKYGGVFRTQGVAGTYAATYEFQALMNSAGAAWFDDPGFNWAPSADTAEAAQAGTWLRELAKLGPASTTTIGQAQVIAAMQSGDAAQTYAVAAAAAGLESKSDSSVAGKIGYSALPPAADGSASSATGLWVLGIPTGLPKERAEAALSYITWMSSAKAQTLFAQYGGIPVRSDAYKPDATTEAAQATLAAVQSTAAKLPEKPTSLRYAFSTDMLNITEPALQKIAAGESAPKEGMSAIQSGLEALVKKEDLPTG